MRAELERRAALPPPVFAGHQLQLNCHFLSDWLKTEAPFWKSEETPAGERWVAARAEDDAARERWNPPLPENREKI
jgi:hypothetical protein